MDKYWRKYEGSMGYIWDILAQTLNRTGFQAISPATSRFFVKTGFVMTFGNPFFPSLG